MIKDIKYKYQNVIFEQFELKRISIYLEIRINESFEKHSYWVIGLIKKLNYTLPFNLDFHERYNLLIWYHFSLELNTLHIVVASIYMYIQKRDEKVKMEVRVDDDSP